MRTVQLLFQISNTAQLLNKVLTRPCGYKTFFMLKSTEYINVKIPKILTFSSMINSTSESLKSRKSLFFSVLVFIGSLNSVELSLKKTFIILGPVLFG